MDEKMTTEEVATLRKRKFIAIALFAAIIIISVGSGPCLVRIEGDDDWLGEIAAVNAMALGAGHAFVILLKDVPCPVDVLNAVKSCQGVCGIYCATANPLQAMVVETFQGMASLVSSTAARPKGLKVKATSEIEQELLSEIGYKRS